jgi:hypothetical protein
LWITGCRSPGRPLNRLGLPRHSPNRRSLPLLPTSRQHLVDRHHAHDDQKENNLDKVSNPGTKN